MSSKQAQRLTRRLATANSSRSVEQHLRIPQGLRPRAARKRQDVCLHAAWHTETDAWTDGMRAGRARHHRELREV
ncbi:hypothetical protein [Xanthomonas arboricola]|uniref:hypothetical protein n=1 Tax=Xanthomonas arboricola TaxID=56448 RepID=UPI00128FD307|nr:hypothetical protein [Xanthomonas arboricola]